MGFARKTGILLFLLSVIPHPALGKRRVIKIGTLAPSGSAWLDVISEFKKELAEKTGIKLIVYPSGIMGDESEMLKKIREGKLHGGGFIVKAMKEIAPEMEVLDIPFLFRGYDEVNFIYREMFSDFEKIFERHGFILLGMTHHGFVKFFSTKEMRSFSDLKKLRTWAWHGEPTIGSFLSALGIKPVFMMVPDLISGIDSGLIEAFQTTPLSCIAMQWCKLVKYVLDIDYRYEPGIVVLSKKVFDNLTEDERKILKELGRKYTEKLSSEMEKLQFEAEKKLRESGIKFIRPPENEVKTLSQKILSMFENKVKSKELLRKLKEKLREYRRM